MSLQTFVFFIFLTLATSYVMPHEYFDAQKSRNLEHEAVMNYPSHFVDKSLSFKDYSSRHVHNQFTPGAYDSLDEMKFARPTFGHISRPVVPPNPENTRQTIRCAKIGTYFWSDTKIVVKCPANAKRNCTALLGDIGLMMFNPKSALKVVLKPGQTYVTYVSFDMSYGVCNPDPVQEFTAYGT
eukprot:TRINITY_DN64235_c0_g1_i1.p1 TRINITY_DN64235_c0_g1~~TRINITY_DN64235_c0_g1_i1.p1  ORF type:complete len:183 (-),score=10.48 TRINITY_DN64235_c0_g1_i1:336-884(-)